MVFFFSNCRITSSFLTYQEARIRSESSRNRKSWGAEVEERDRTREIIEKPEFLYDPAAV